MSEPRRPPGDAGVDPSAPLRDENAGAEFRESPAGPGRLPTAPIEPLPTSAPAEELVVGVASPRDQRRRASLPWLAAALVLAGAALALAYLVFMRPPRE